MGSYPPPPYDQPSPTNFHAHGANANVHAYQPFNTAQPNSAFGTANEQDPTPPPLSGDATFDILEWHPAHQSCQRYFLDHAQHEPGTQALCALINIRLPFQSLDHPIHSSTAPPAPAAPTAAAVSHGLNLSRPGGTGTPNASVGGPNNPFPSPNRSRGNSEQAPPVFVSLLPYIRRLVVTGFDKPAILHGFFGDDYTRGVLPHVDCERRNYLFAAKHGGWRSCKKQYDAGSGHGTGTGDESVPFLKPLDAAHTEEISAAEKAWGRWLCMEDWMVGAQAPGATEGASAEDEMVDRRDRSDAPETTQVDGML